MPLEWAARQNNLGSALLGLGRRDTGTEYLNLAVTAFLGALEERKRERVPIDWAASQNNLGNALTELGKRTGNRQLLEQARDAYRSALEVLNVSDASRYRETAQHGLDKVSSMLKQ